MTDTTSMLVIPRDVTLLMEQSNISAYGTKMNSINKFKLTNLIIDSMPLVRNVGIYNAAGGKLCINVEQRTPILRIINNNQQGYYIDNEGYIFPLSKHYGHRSLIANGDIKETIKRYKAIHIDSLYSNKSKETQTLKELYQLAHYIWNDDLLRALIEQIYVNRNEYEMIPRIGSQVIYFGTIENIENKFFNLKTVYFKVFSNLGWQKYKTINLKFENQVICVKR